MDASPDLIEHWIRRLVESLDELETQQALEGSGTGNEFTGVLGASSVNEIDLVNGGAVLADLDLLAEMVTAASYRQTEVMDLIREIHRQLDVDRPEIVRSRVDGQHVEEPTSQRDVG